MNCLENELKKRDLPNCLFSAVPTFVFDQIELCSKCSRCLTRRHERDFFLASVDDKTHWMH